MTYNSRFVYPTVFRRTNTALHGLIITGIAVAVLCLQGESAIQTTVVLACGKLSRPGSFFNWQFLVFWLLYFAAGVTVTYSLLTNLL